MVEQIIHAVPRLHYILHYYYVAPLDIEVDAELLFHLARRLGTLVRGNFHERQPAVESSLAHQIAHKEERSAQHPQKHGRAARVTFVKPLGHTLHRGIYLFGGDHHAESLVVKSDFVLH